VTPVSARRLLAAALEAFASRGYHGTTTRDIATRVNMSSAAIYSHYSSKEALLYQIVKSAHVNLLGRMRSALAIYVSPIQRVHSLATTLARFHATMHTAARVATYEMPFLAPKHRSEIAALREEMAGMMRATLSQGRASGDFILTNLELTNLMILSIAIDISRWYSPKGHLTADEIADVYAANVLHMLTPHRQPVVGTPPALMWNVEVARE
jgi:AcrR family transcriptional regulator